MILAMHGATVTTSSDPAIVPASDAFVLSTLVCLWFLIACFVIGAWVLWCRSTRPQPHQRLMIEMEDDANPADAQASTIGGAEEKTPPPWEKPADWWKN